MLFVDTNIEYVLPPSVQVEPTDEPVLMLHNGCECPCHQQERPRNKTQHAQKAQDQDLFHLIGKFAPNLSNYYRFLKKEYL